MSEVITPVLSEVSETDVLEAPLSPMIDDRINEVKEAVEKNNKISPQKETPKTEKPQKKAPEKYAEIFFDSFKKETHSSSQALDFLKNKIKDYPKPENLFTKEKFKTENKGKPIEIEKNLPQYFLPLLAESAENSVEDFWKQWKVFSTMQADVIKTTEDVKNLNLKSIGETLSDGYPVFAKTIQTIGNLIPANSEKGGIFQNLVSLIQSNLPQRISTENRKRILEKNAESIIQFEEEPLGVGTIGQANKILTENGEEVVKMKKTDIEQKFKDNRNSIMILIKALSKYVSVSISDPILKKENEEILHLIEVHWDYIVNIFSEELDFENEKKNIKKVHKIFENRRGIISPKLNEKLSGGDAIVMDFIAGKNIDDAMEDLDEKNKKIVRRRLLKAVRVLRKKGLFHADMHKGNFLVNGENEVGIIDMGAVTDKIKTWDVIKIMRLTNAVKKKKEPSTILRRYLRICGKKLSKNDRKLVLTEISESQKNGEDVNSVLGSLYKKLAIDHGIFPPEKYLKTFKSLAGLVGTLKPFYEKGDERSAVIDYFVWSRFV